MSGSMELDRFDTDGLTERDIVFQVWALLEDRSPKRTAERCLSDYGLQVDAAKISVWAGRYEWATKARTLFGDVAPTFLERAASSLVGGAPAAARFLIDASEGKPNATLPNGQVDRGRVVAAVSVLDRVGFLPHTRKDAERNGTPVHAGRGADIWSSMDDADLADIIAGRIDALPDKLT
jgi:hypothetical protein